MKLIRRTVYTVNCILLLLLFFPSPVYAKCPDIKGLSDAASFTCLEGVFINILGLVIAGASLAFFIMILSGGIKWLTSSGDPKDLENAKGRITFAAFGLVLMILSWFILKFISEFTFGSSITDITKFQIPQ